MNLSILCQGKKECRSLLFLLQVPHGHFFQLEPTSTNASANTTHPRLNMTYPGAGTSTESSLSTIEQPWHHFFSIFITMVMTTPELDFNTTSSAQVGLPKSQHQTPDVAWHDQTLNSLVIKARFNKTNSHKFWAYKPKICVLYYLWVTITYPNASKQNTT